MGHTLHSVSTVLRVAWPLETVPVVEQSLRVYVYRSVFLLNRLSNAGFDQIYIPADWF
jgi:hypothetical protein